MKFRLVDLLKCPRCSSQTLTLADVKTRRAAVSEAITSVQCNRRCAFRKLPLAEVTPRDCIECYSNEIDSGTLRCECGAGFSIINGIPRFLPPEMEDDIRRTQKTFSLEWKMFRPGERNWGQDIEWRKRQFLRAFGYTPEETKGKLILDAGCGSGLLSIEMARSFGMKVVALDLAFGIEQAYRFNDNPFVNFMQGSVLEPPVRRAFDCVYCAGVLVALPDARKGFRAIKEALKPAGRCFIWMYHPIDRKHHPDDYRKILIYNFIRTKITSRMPIGAQRALYLSFIPLFMAKQSIESFLGRRDARLTWREKMQAFVDFFSPVYQHRYAPEEIVPWFKEEGFENVEVVYREKYGFGVRGDLPVSSHKPTVESSLRKS